MALIIREDGNFEEVSAELEQRLRSFNEAAGGALGRMPVALTIRGADGSLVAGLTGEIFWNAMYVHRLWVSDTYRRRGYGTALLQECEGIARSRSCDISYLSTFSFQAPQFYEARGYVAFGELDNVPPGSKRLWFRKDLRVTAS